MIMSRRSKATCRAPVEKSKTSSRATPSPVGRQAGRASVLDQLPRLASERRHLPDARSRAREHGAISLSRPERLDGTRRSGRDLERVAPGEAQEPELRLPGRIVGDEDDTRAIG
jgi:hypothetical protein